MNKNLKRIGAIVAGVSILASSVAFAGLVYKNTELVNADGEPVAKVVVGSNAMASDGVAAALISNKLANEAYKTTSLTAEIVGEPSCSDVSAASSEVVEGSETVTLRVSVPGAEAGADFTTAIGDYVDKELGNRYTSETDSDEAYTVFDDVEDADANPFQNFVGGFVTDASFDAAGIHQIALGERIVETPSKEDIVEKEDISIKGSVNYDEGEQELFGEVSFVSYRALFDAGGNNGLELCVEEDDEWSDCADLDKLESNSVSLNFLGEEWIVSGVENIKDSNVATEENEIYAVDGAKLKLAKEAVSGIINVGETLEAPSGYKVRLDDISRETGEENDHPAIVTVLDANGNEVCQEQIGQGETRDDLCYEKTGVRLHVYQTAPGLNFIAKWAEMAIYKDEIELESGAEFLDGDTEWEVTLAFSNEDISKNDPEYLRAIYLSNEELEANELKAGDSVSITNVEGYENYALTYNGIESGNYDDLEFKVAKSEDFKVVTETSDECEITDAYGVEVSTDAEFRFDGHDAETVWYLTEADASNCSLSGDKFLLVESDEDYLYELADAGDTGSIAVDYKHAGSQGHLNFYWYPSGANYDRIALVENAGKYNNADIVDALSLGFHKADYEFASALVGGAAFGDEDYAGFTVADEDAVDGDSGLVKGHEIAFSENGYEADTQYEEGFISLRGTEFKSGSDSSYEFEVPDKVLTTSWSFTGNEDAGSDGLYVLHEGETQSVGGGVSVEVVAIDQEITPCSAGIGAGSAPVCSVDTSGVGAVIMPQNAATVDAVVPYEITESLVYLDSDNIALDSGVIITVGGDAVNTVTADALDGTVDFEAENVVVKQIGNKIIVAGLTAEDTMTAAQQFLAELVE